MTRPVTLSFYVRGGLGENSDFSMLEGLGPNPSGPAVGRDYKRAHWSLGVSGDTVLREDLTVFASFFYSQDRQRDDLLLSDVQRYFQETVPLTFRSAGSLDFQTDELGIVLGSQLWFSEKTDGGFSYSFTQARASYDDSDNGRALQLIDDNRVVDADIHALDLEIRHQIRDGMRAFVGYRYQYYSDGSPSPSSATPQTDRTQGVHTLSFGLTLNSDLLESRR